MDGEVIRTRAADIHRLKGKIIEYLMGAIKAFGDEELRSKALDNLTPKLDKPHRGYNHIGTAIGIVPESEWAVFLADPQALVFFSSCLVSI